MGHLPNINCKHYHNKYGFCNLKERKKFFKLFKRECVMIKGIRCDYMENFKHGDVILETPHTWPEDNNIDKDEFYKRQVPLPRIKSLDKLVGDFQKYCGMKSEIDTGIFYSWTLEMQFIFIKISELTSEIEQIKKEK